MSESRWNKFFDRSLIWAGGVTKQGLCNPLGWGVDGYFVIHPSDTTVLWHPDSLETTAQVLEVKEEILILERTE